MEHHAQSLAEAQFGAVPESRALSSSAAAPCLAEHCTRWTHADLHLVSTCWGAGQRSARIPGSATGVAGGIGVNGGKSWSRDSRVGTASTLGSSILWGGAGLRTQWEVAPWCQPQLCRRGLGRADPAAWYPAAPSLAAPSPDTGLTCWHSPPRGVDTASCSSRPSPGTEQPTEPHPCPHSDTRNGGSQGAHASGWREQAGQSTGWGAAWDHACQAPTPATAPQSLTSGSSGLKNATDRDVGQGGSP